MLFRFGFNKYSLPLSLKHFLVFVFADSRLKLSDCFTHYLFIPHFSPMSLSLAGDSLRNKTQGGDVAPQCNFTNQAVMAQHFKKCMLPVTWE